MDAPDKNIGHPTVGLALGSGSARGWAHIGVLEGLLDCGIEPHIVCGTSIGALVGALYARDSLSELRKWVCSISRKEMLHYLDIKLIAGGGFIEGKKIMALFREGLGDVNIEELPKPFAAVATDLDSGHEIWLREGPLADSVRASMALPGIFTPVNLNGRWLVDGGLVNPVPVSLCRAMGADIVIAVNLNENIAGKHRNRLPKVKSRKNYMNSEETLMDRLSAEFKERADSVMSHLFESGNGTPGLFDVMAGSINIMQDRITRSRMAGDPPDITLAPRLSHIGLMEFYRGRESIEEGKGCVKRNLPLLQELA